MTHRISSSVAAGVRDVPTVRERKLGPGGSEHEVRVGKPHRPLAHQRLTRHEHLCVRAEVERRDRVEQRAEERVPVVGHDRCDQGRHHADVLADERKPRRERFLVAGRPTFRHLVARVGERICRGPRAVGDARIGWTHREARRKGRPEAVDPRASASRAAQAPSKDRGDRGRRGSAARGARRRPSAPSGPRRA